MADGDHFAPNLPAQTATPQRVLPGGAPGIVCRSIAVGAEDNNPLWDGHIIDAIFSLV
jgi:hypothetical protein